MRYFVGFAGLLAALLTLPLSARAQAEGFSEDEVTKVALVSSSSRAFSTEYSLIYTEYAEEVKDMDRRVHNAKIGLGVSAVPIVIGAVLALAAAGSSVGAIGSDPPDTTQADALLIGGSVLMVGGAASMIATGILLGVRKRKRRRAAHGTTRPVRWDLASSGVVF